MLQAFLNPRAVFHLVLLLVVASKIHHDNVQAILKEKC